MNWPVLMTADATTPPPCPVTGRPMRPWLSVSRDWRRPGHPGGWQLWWSEAGHYGQVYPRPDAAAIGGFYDLPAYYTHENMGSAARQGMLGRLMVALAWRLDRGCPPDAAYWRDVLPRGPALELGCGNGDRLTDIAPFVTECVGVEPDVKARKKAQEKGLTVLEGTAEILPEAVSARRFDAILFMHVLEHCADPALALAQAAGLLSDDGVMVIEVPNNAALGLRQAGAYWRWLDVPRHLNFFTGESLRAFVTQAGLRVLRVDHDGYTRQFLPDWIADEAVIEAVLAGRRAEEARNQRHVWRALRLLLRTALAPASQKYDSVRLVCRKA